MPPVTSRGRNRASSLQVSRNNISSGPNNSANRTKPSRKKTEEEKPQTPGPKVQSFDLDKAFLTCGVCLEILHNPVNVSPCNHKFCAQCMYHWMDRNQSCPACRNGHHDVSEDGFIGKICEEYVKSFPEQDRTNEVKKILDKNELEYLEKLKARMDNSRDEPALHDFENLPNDLRRDIMRTMSGLPSFRRRLTLTPCRFRDQQWERRIKRLREQLQIPPRVAPNPPHRNEVAAPRTVPEELRFMLGVMRPSRTPPHIRQMREARSAAVNRTLLNPNRPTSPSAPPPSRPPLNRAERYERRERRSLEAERERSPQNQPALSLHIVLGFPAGDSDEDTSSRD